MIDFKHKLPSINADGHRNGTYNNIEMVLPCILNTDSPRLGLFLHLLHNEIEDNRSLVFIEGKVLVCNKNWIRDHIHIMKGFKHFEYDLKSYLEFTITHQHEKGYFYELIKQMDDIHWQYVDSDCYVLYPDDNMSLVRLELEADVEYIVVEGVMQYYKATGDIEFVKKYLHNIEKGIDYATSDEKRFSKEYGLCIRPYTIDTWDFVNDLNSGSDRRIHKDEQMCIMHGDNSGVYLAMNQLAFFNEKLGNNEKAAIWRKRAEDIKSNMFRYLWNGSYFVHQLPITGDPLDDKENIRMSLSLPYDINRGVTNHEQSTSIIGEYLKRKDGRAFAEWFSIDPPYEKFNRYNAGEYVNGAISPFTAGELSKAAFNNGFEKYGYDIIDRFVDMAEKDGHIYFLYSPKDGREENGGPSAWGAAALLSAFDEGFAGIVDKDCLYREIDFSPRFVVCPHKEIRYITGYEISHKFVDVRYVVNEKGMRYDVYSDTEKINCHILLPEGKNCAGLFVNNEEKEYKLSKVRNSEYIDFSCLSNKVVTIEIIFRKLKN